MTNPSSIHTGTNLVQHFVHYGYVFYTKADLVFGFTWNQISVACPTYRSGGQLSPDKNQAPRTLLAQFYLGFYPKTIMRWVYFIRKPGNQELAIPLITNYPFNRYGNYFKVNKSPCFRSFIFSLLVFLPSLSRDIFKKSA